MKERIVGIASLPDRVECLKDTIDSLYNQVDKIIVGLNNYTTIPDFLKNKSKIDVYLLDNKLGDAAKFYKIDEYPDAYYFAADDDLIYPPEFTETLINKVKEYNGVVGLHGVIMIPPVKSYYRDRKVYHGLKKLDKDIFVDLVATCSCCFDTSQLKVSINDFKEPNMGDIWLANLAKQQKIPSIAIARPDNWVIYNDKMANKWTIFDHFKTKSDITQTNITSKW